MGIHLASAATPSRPLADEATPFDVTLAVVNTAEDLVVPSVSKEGNRVTIVNEGPGKAFIAFDATATTSDLELGKRDSYEEADVSIVTNISFIGESGKKPRVRGILWSS